MTGKRNSCRFAPAPAPERIRNKNDEKITIQKAQLGLLSREGDYYQVLDAGQHRLPWFNTPEVLIVNRDGGEIPEGISGVFTPLSARWVARFCRVADTTDTEAAALYINGVLQEFLPPASRRLYWRPTKR